MLTCPGSSSANLRRTMRLLVLSLGFASSLACGGDGNAAPPKSAGVPRKDGPELLGVARVSGAARDRSGLSGTLEDGTPADRLGGFGSGLEWTGTAERYLAVCDRGPKDGATSFACRFHEFDVHVSPGTAEPVRVELVATTILVDERGRPFTGLASALVPTEDRAERLDPEGLRVDSAGHVWICDEYSMGLFEFQRDGRLVARHGAPAHFGVERPAADKKRELADNAAGRVPNRGFEGLAREPSTGAFFALAQGPLIQDGGEKGRFARCVEFDAVGRPSAQFVAVLEHVGGSWNDLVALGSGSFLALERDGEKGSDRKLRAVVRLASAGATDVREHSSLREDRGIVPLSRSLAIDLLDPAWGSALAGLPDKIESLALGPDLPDGRRLLLIGTDNDVRENEATWILAFALPK